MAGVSRVSGSAGAIAVCNVRHAETDTRIHSSAPTVATIGRMTLPNLLVALNHYGSARGFAVAMITFGSSVSDHRATADQPGCCERGSMSVVQRNAFR
jgi:hypothetical protein